MSFEKTSNSSTRRASTARGLLAITAVNLLLLVGGATAVHAKPPPPNIQQCLRDAADYQGVPYELLVAIARVESSFNQKALNQNKNSTTDIGLMQINTTWLPAIKKYGVHRESLWNPCINAQVGAWILAQNIKQFGFTLEAVGAYNAGPRGNPKVKLNYAKKVLEHYHHYLGASSTHSRR